MNTHFIEPEFNGNAEICMISQTSLDFSMLILKPNDCLSNAGKIAEQYNFCKIVEGVLCIRDCEDGGICYTRHAWNYDSRAGIYFDVTTKLDEIKLHKENNYDYVHYNCCEYELSLAGKRFKYSYTDLINYLRTTINRKYYRPTWTCGRYNAEKHVAIMYNLLAGYSFFFESYSADVIGHILAVKRDSEVKISTIAEATGIAIESIKPFFNQLLEQGLLTDHIYNNDEIDNSRHQLATIKKSQQAWIDKSVEEKLPMDTSSAEQRYFDAVDNGKTICSVMFELTYRCSEKCIHCYNPGATRNDNEISHRGDLKELTLDEYKQIIDDLNKNGLVKVCLSGGDPFSNKNAWEIIDYLYQKEIAFDVFTNGQRIINDVKRLAEYFPRLVGVSIYSGVAEDHDAITRIPGSWQRSMQVVRQLSELAVPMNLKYCVMQPNLHTYYMVADLAKEHGAQPQFEINITESNDGDLCAKQLRLTEEQLQVALRDKNLSLYVGKDVPGYGNVPINKQIKACKAGSNSFCLAPNGDIKPCCAFPMTFINLKDSQLTDIFENNLYQEWNNSNVAQYEGCGDFPYCGYCSLCSGCNYVENGDFRKPAETNCYMAKVRYNLARKLMNNYTELTREQFVEALQKLPKDKVILQRLFATKG